MGIEREDRTLLPPATPLCFVRGAGYFSHLSCFIVLCFLILLTTFNRPIILFRCSVMISAAAAAAKSLQLCRTLCDPIDSSPPGSAIPGILQARTLEWVAISFSNAWRWKVKVKSLSRVWLFATPWTAAYQAPPSMGFSRQEYWSGVPLPSLSHIWKHAICVVFCNCSFI